MPAFALPQAVSPRVAATLSRYAHYPLLDRACPGARTYDIAALPGAASRATPGKLPGQLTLIFDRADRSVPTQVHLGRVPVPSRFWSYDPHRGVLAYQFKSGSVDHIGQLTFAHAGASAVGTLAVGREQFGVQAVLQPISYTCDVAIGTGATVTGVAPALTLHWDSTDPRWSNATWVENALTFTWQIVSQPIVGQPSYSVAVSFRDQQTQTPWTPGTTDFATLFDANYDFTMTLNAGLTPPPDNRGGLSGPAASIASVFPYVLGFKVSSDGTQITGALLTGQASQAGTVLGLRGRVVLPSAAGLYAISGAQGDAAGAVGVYGGRLYINDAPVETASLAGSRLAWSRLTADQQKQSGLPESGAMVFQANGAQCGSPQSGITGRRLQPDQIPRQLQNTAVTAHPALATASAVSATATLNPLALNSMTQFKFANNVWADVVQQATMADFNQILLYYMPDDMRQTYYNVAKPVLPPWLQSIASQGASPAAAYQSLATAYLTNILSHFTEDGADQLNAARAANWLKAQTAANAVLQQHTTAIYATEFTNQPENAALLQYLQDQANDTGTYAGFIASDAQAWQQSLAQTIVDQPSLTTMQGLVTELSSLAINNNLYWAYYFFKYLTGLAQLMTIQMVSLGQTSDLDGSAFMRQCQTNAAMLSLLDPSNIFAQKYVEVIQVFQLGNMLPTLFDLSGPDTDDFVFDVQLVLQKIAEKYQADSDPDVAEAAATASQLAQSQELRSYVELAQGVAAGNAGLRAWDQLAPNIESKIGAQIGAKGAQVFMMALAGVAVMGIAFGAVQWSSLSTDEQASLGANGAALAIQLFAGVVKRGVAVAAVWDTSSSGWEIFKGLLSGDILDQASGKLDSGFQKWIVERNPDADPNSFRRMAVINDAETGEVEFASRDESMASKIFGRNLDEALGTRLGAALAVVNLVLSIYAAVHAGDPLERVADGLMATAAGLDLIAAVAGWALGALGIAEVGTEAAAVAVSTICSAIGALGILAALVGVAILLYLVFRPKQNPVQQFGSTYAQPAGFFMPNKSEIDYFLGYVTGTELARIGCSFAVPDASTVLSVASDGTTVGAAGQSYDYHTVFVISTRGTGESRILAVVPTSSSGLQTRALTWATDNTVSFQLPFDPKSASYSSQLWTLQMQGQPQMDGAFPAAAAFSVTAAGTSSALVWNGTGLVLGSGPNWTIQQVPMAPGGLSMRNIRLYTFSTGESFRPTLTQGGSAPKTWSVTPALPPFLTLDVTSGQISQTGTNPPVTAKTQYTLSVTNGIGTAPPGAPFTVEVVSLT